MKSIILLSSHYSPETGAAAKRTQATAQYLQTKGWRVTVVTLLPHHPANEIYEGFDTVGPFVQNEEGVQVVRYRPWLVPKTSLALRLAAELLFCWHALLFALRHSHDLVFGSSPYMFIGPTALLAGRLSRAKVVWEVRDLTWLYPRSAGKKTFGLDIVLEKLMRWTASSADALVTATGGLLNYFSQRPEAALVVYNGVTPEQIKRLEYSADKPLFRHSRPRVLYAGLFGYNHDLAVLLESAKLLPNIDFTLAGDGPQKDALLQKAQTLGLQNVSFVGHLSADELAQAYVEHDILVSHVRRDPLHLWTQPAKLWEYMATGRPIVHAGEGEIIDIIQRGGLGLTCAPGDPRVLANAMQNLVDNPQKAADMGTRARTFVEHKRNRATLIGRLEALLSSLL